MDKTREWTMWSLHSQLQAILPVTCTVPFFLFQVGAIYRHGASKRALRTFNLGIVKKNQSKTEESRKNIENYASELIEVRG